MHICSLGGYIRPQAPTLSIVDLQDNQNRLEKDAFLCVTITSHAEVYRKFQVYVCQAKACFEHA